MQVLPHRYPFLLIDRIVEQEKFRRIVAHKCVTLNEPYFAGHFPGQPVMPGVLIIEALAQATAVLILSEVPDRDRKLIYFTGIDECRFRRPVVPGDVLKLEIELTNLRPRAAKARGVATVDGQIAAEALLMSAMVDREG
jgi:3-hydroxyacyl-[acyl-carrier-protein] dehydratase